MMDTIERHRRVFALIEEGRRRPYRWSERDCVGETSRLVEALSGSPLSPSRVSIYRAIESPARCAARMVREFGSVAEAWDSLLTAHPSVEKIDATKQRQPGDICVFKGHQRAIALSAITWDATGPAGNGVGYVGTDAGLYAHMETRWQEGSMSGPSLYKLAPGFEIIGLYRVREESA